MANKRLPITGGCLCGAIRWECTEPPDSGGCCHCSMCQKGFGGLFGAWLNMPASAFRFTKGNPKFYKSSKSVKRGFCSACGSPLIFLDEGDPRPGINVGSLDHPDDWPLTEKGYWGHSHIGNKVSWEIIADGMPQHQGHAF